MNEPRRFVTTIWSNILRAQAGSTGALDQFCKRYRPPVHGWLRAQGLGPTDADDLAQEVFGRVVTHRLLQKADREKWPVRSLLIGISRNVLREHRRAARAQRRGGAHSVVSLSAEDGQIDPVDPRGETEQDDLFDDLWVRNLVEAALERIESSRSRHGALYAEIFRARSLEGLSHEELLERFDLELHDVKNYLHRARVQLRRHIRDIIGDYAGSQDEYAAELRYLSNFLPGKTRDDRGAGD